MLPPLDVGQTMEELDAALESTAADEFEIAVLARAGEYTRFAGQLIHQPQDIVEAQYLVRALVNGHPYRVTTSTATGLKRAVAAAAEGARTRASLAADPGEVRLARPPQPGAGGPGIYWHDDTAAFDAGTRSVLAGKAMAEAAEAGGAAAGMLGRAVTQQFVATTSGIRRVTTATEAAGAMTITIEDGTSHWIDLGRSARLLNTADSVTRAVAEARASRGRSGLPAGSYEVVLGAEAMGELLGFLPALGFSGTLAAAGLGITGRVGQQVASPMVTIADDGGADIGLPIDCDIEGVTKRRVEFFSGGRVGEPVTDLATSAALGRPSTGHAHIAREQVPEPTAANIIMSPGVGTEDDLIAQVERGVYVQRFWYTRLLDRITGTITGVTRDACFLIENGRLITPLEGMRFTESVLGVLAGIEDIGSDVRSQPIMNVWNGAVSAPAARSRAFRLGVAPIEGAS